MIICGMVLHFRYFHEITDVSLTNVTGGTNLSLVQLQISVMKGGGGVVNSHNKYKMKTVSVQCSATFAVFSLTISHQCSVTYKLKVQCRI